MRPLRAIYEQCKIAGLVSSQPECSALFGRTESWLSSMLAREGERRVSSEALLAFYFSLTRAEQEPNTRQRLDIIRQMRAETWAEIAGRLPV